MSSPVNVRTLAILVVVCLAWPATANAQPSDGEQLFIYEMNRARSNPQAYAAEAGLGNLLDGVAAQPPLAVNNLLVDSARFHAVEMAQNNYFAHQSAVTNDWPNKMIRDATYPLASWLPDNQNNTESLAAGTIYNSTQAAGVLRLLIEDVGVTPPGHRNHLLAITAFAQNFVEVGVGYGYDATSTYTNYWAIHTGFRDPDNPFITGVVYNDINGDGQYSHGEGLSGVTVTANPGGLSTTTNAAGGFAIEASNTTYTVSATGGAFTGTSSGQVTVSGANVAVDFKDGETEPEVGFGNQTFSGNLGGDSGSASCMAIAAVSTGGPLGDGDGDAPARSSGDSLSGYLLLALLVAAVSLRRLRL